MIIDGVSGDYQDKVRIAIRRFSEMDDSLTAELGDVVKECRRDLQRLGVSETTTEDENNLLILDAVKRYARWSFEPVTSSARAALWDEYRLKADELRRHYE